jgi:N-acyl-D-amino-acid deacylase
MKYDLAINNGNIVAFNPDGIRTGVNIGVRDGKIRAITKDAIDGKETIDAKNRVVSPGFIDFHSHVNGRLYSAKSVALQGATTTIGGERNFDAAIIPNIESDGFLINQGFYISYSFTLRRSVGLHDPTAVANSKQIAHMIGLTERFLDFGVLGIHLGLEYAPGTSYAEIEELLSLAKANERIAMVHLRKDGYDAMESLEEIIRAASRTGAAVNILHVMYTAGLEGLLDTFLERIESARQDGCDISADTGLYKAYPTFAGSMSLGEGWAKGYREGVSEKDLMISSGVRIGNFCTETSFKYIRKEFPNTLITAFVYDENQIARAIVPEYMMISSNAAYGPHSDTVGHPEGSGTFPKLFETYVREEKILSLPDAVKKITFMPARRIGLINKGNIAEGYDADITIFDLARISSHSDYVGFGDPNAVPGGVDYVIVGGRVIVDHGDFRDLDRFSGELVRFDAGSV